MKLTNQMLANKRQPGGSTGPWLFSWLFGGFYLLIIFDFIIISSSNLIKCDHLLISSSHLHPTGVRRTSGGRQDESFLPLPMYLVMYGKACSATSKVGSSWRTKPSLMEMVKRVEATSPFSNIPWRLVNQSARRLKCGNFVLNERIFESDLRVCCSVAMMICLICDVIFCEKLWPMID